MSRLRADVSKVVLGLAVVLAACGSHRSVASAQEKPSASTHRMKGTVATSHGGEQVLEFGRFGLLSIYSPRSGSRAVALFVSGDGGWNKGVVDMARELVQLGVLVVGIDIRHYLAAVQKDTSACWNGGVDFEALGQYVQKKLALPSYTPPVLVGYSSGATLVYSVLVQAPEGTFAGAVSLGFCPDLAVTKGPCQGEGLTFHPDPRAKGIIVEANPKLASPWHVLQGDVDKVCDPPSTKAYVSRIPSAKVYMLPKVGHGFSVPRSWLPQFRSAFSEIATGIEAKKEAPAETHDNPAVQGPARTNGDRNVDDAARPPAGTDGGVPPPDVSDLPLVEVSPRNRLRDRLAVILTGDGGWAGLDREVGGALASRGIRVVGWNSLRYYWTPRSPESAAADLARILRHYLSGRPSDDVLLIGYSLGADVAPFLAARLPDELKARVRLITLIAPSTYVSFEIHLSNWLGGKPSDSLSTLPETLKLAGTRLLCLYGADEKDSLCPKLGEDHATIESLRGGHHFGGDYGSIAQRILTAAEIETH